MIGNISAFTYTRVDAHHAREVRIDIFSRRSWSRRFLISAHRQDGVSLYPCSPKVPTLLGSLSANITAGLKCSAVPEEWG